LKKLHIQADGPQKPRKSAFFLPVENFTQRHGAVTRPRPAMRWRPSGGKRRRNFFGLRIGRLALGERGGETGEHVGRCGGVAAAGETAPMIARVCPVRAGARVLTRTPACPDPYPPLNATSGFHLPT
jgi:hypothetical protein